MLPVSLDYPFLIVPSVFSNFNLGYTLQCIHDQTKSPFPFYEGEGTTIVNEHGECNIIISFTKYLVTSVVYTQKETSLSPQ